MPKGLPEDTEITYCYFCREWHGLEKFCPTTCQLWCRRWYGKAAVIVDRIMEKAAYTIAVFALACFAIALGVALFGLLRSALESSY